MGRKPITQEKIDQIINLSAAEATAADIAENLGLSVTSIRQYQNKYRDQIEKKREEFEIPSEEKEKTGFIPVHSDDKKKKEQKPKIEPLDKPTHDKFIRKGSEITSTKLERMLKELIHSGETIMDLELRYRQSIETMGMSWTDFLSISVELGYDNLTEIYREKLENLAREELMDRLTTMDIEEELNKEEMEEMEDMEDMEGPTEEIQEESE